MKAGKEKKAAPTKAPKEAAPVDPQEQVAGAHLDKPSGVDHPAADQPSGVTKEQAKAVKPGTVAIVSKGAERIPVQLKDDAHLEQLRQAHGAASVEVQS